MTFTFDPSTDEGLLRTYVDDKVESGAIFTDEELTNVLSANDGDIWAAAADLCFSLASKYAKEAFDLGLGKNDIKLDRRKKAEYYLSLAKQYGSKSNTFSPAEYWDSFNIKYDGSIDESEYIGDLG